MRSRYNIPKLSRKECSIVYGEAAKDAAKSVIGAVLMVCHLRKWHKERIIKLFDDILAVMDMPEICGKTMTDYDVQQFITKKYGIDFDRVHINFEVVPENQNPKTSIIIPRSVTK